MTVSIIIPAYNSEKFIKRCLDSVINQIYKNLEIIVIDDASKDNTKQIIKEYAEKDNRIRPFYSNENKGVSFSRNIGLKASTGEYIMFVDSDDELTKDAVRRMIDIAVKYNSDYVDSYEIVKYTKRNNKVCMFTESKVPKKHLVLGNIKENPKIISMYMYSKGKLIKRELVGDLIYDESLRVYEDVVFEQTLKSRVKNYVMMNKPVYFYYQREDSLINALGKKHTYFLESVKRVKLIYEDFDKNIKDIIEGMLFQNAFLTLFTKVIKNNDGITKNIELSKAYLEELVNLFPNYKDNKKLNKIIKSLTEKLLNNDKKIERFIKLTSKINFISLYFNFLSIKNKYKLKNPLD